MTMGRAGGRSEESYPRNDLTGSSPVRSILEYDGTPPSLNALAYKHWRKFHRVKQEWQGIFEVLLMEQPLERSRIKPPYVRAFASAVLRFPNRRRRDEGNYRAMIEKALGDALVNGGWLDDDTADHFRVGEVTFDPEPGPSNITVVVSLWRG